jgi:hypothetical protein
VNTGTSLELLSDTLITNPKTQGQVISWDANSSKWVNNGVSVTGYNAEYLQFKILTGSCEISPNTTGEFGISSAIGFFTATPTAGTCIFDTS